MILHERFLANFSQPFLRAGFVLDHIDISKKKIALKQFCVQISYERSGMGSIMRLQCSWNYRRP